MRRGINKIPKCFSCPGDSKELSKKTKRSTYGSNQARTKPWPTRPPTSDNNSPITKRIRTQNVSLTLAIVADCRKKEGGRCRNQGSSQLTVWQWLTRVECKLTSQPRIQNRQKKGDNKTPGTIQNLRRRQETDQSNHSQHFQGPSSMTMWVWLSL